MRWAARPWGWISGKEGMDPSLGEDVVNDALSLMAVPGILKYKAQINTTGNCSDVCYVPSVNRMYALDYTNAQIRVYNATTFALVTSIAMTAADNPQSIVYSSTTDRLYVTAYGANVVRIYNPNTNALVSSVAVGTNPKNATWCSNTNQVAVCNYASSNVSWVDCATAAVTATTAVSANPQCFTRNAYLTRADVLAATGAVITADYVIVSSLTTGRVDVIDASTKAIWNFNAMTLAGGGGYPSVYVNGAAFCIMDARAYVPWNFNASWAKHQPFLNSPFDSLASFGCVGWPTPTQFFYDSTRRLMFGRIAAGVGGNKFRYAFFTPEPVESGVLPFGTNPPVLLAEFGPGTGGTPANAPNGDNAGATVDTTTGNIWTVLTGNIMEVVGA